MAQVQATAAAVRAQVPDVRIMVAAAGPKLLDLSGAPNEVRIGLALSDESQIIASPLDTLTRRRGKRFPMPRFLELIGAHAPVGLVVGLPLTPDGGERPATAAARELATLLGGRTGLPVELVDERVTTARAHADEYSWRSCRADSLIDAANSGFR